MFPSLLTDNFLLPSTIIGLSALVSNPGFEAVTTMPVSAYFRRSTRERLFLATSPQAPRP
jgi:hypothetical protein